MKLLQEHTKRPVCAVGEWEKEGGGEGGDGVGGWGRVGVGGGGRVRSDVVCRLSQVTEVTMSV